MTRAQAWTLHASTVLVGGTGLAYAYTRYLAEPSDPFAIVNHPWQPALRAWHVVLAPALLFAGGWVWQDHVWKRIVSAFRPRRRSGLALAALFGPMVASGYLLQVAESDAWRTAWIWVHVASSVVWLPVYGVHQMLPRGRGRRGSAREPDPRGAAPATHQECQ